MKELDLQEIRQRIDKIDNALAALFEERMQVVGEVAAYKKAHHLPVRDQKREDLVLAKVESRVKNPANVKPLQQVMRTIMAEAVAQEEEQLAEPGAVAKTSTAAKLQGVLAYQGVPGAYSYVALSQYFGTTEQSKAYTSFEEVVKAVEQGEAAYGVLPIENSSTGGITEVYDLLRRYGVHIVGEVKVKIEHNLMACPGTKLADITEVYSHPQGFAQCQDFFKEHPQMQQRPYFNTARSAQFVAEQKQSCMAAVAGRQAAERYGLDILVPHLNKNTHNYTRFIVVAAKSQEVSAADKITLVVALKHEPGSLYRFLHFFEEAGVNVVNLESRPIEGRSWEYFFHVDLQGNLLDAKLQKVLKKVEAACVSFKVLGNYCAAH